MLLMFLAQEIVKSTPCLEIDYTEMLNPATTATPTKILVLILPFEYWEKGLTTTYETDWHF